MRPAKRKVRTFEEPSKNNNEMATEVKAVKKLKIEDFQKTLNKGLLRKVKPGNVKNEKRNKPFKSKKTVTGKELQLIKMKWRDRKKEYKKSKNKVFDICSKAKLLWEVVRRDDCSKEKKEQLLQELMTLVKGHVREIIFAHDTSRVIQCIVSLGTDEQRKELFEEMKNDILLLALSKYAKNFLIKIFNYGTKQQKDFIIKALQGHIAFLIKHTEAASVVECAYNEYANVKQRAAMVQEFYGATFKFFKDTTCNSLSDLISKDPTKKEEIIGFMKPVLLRILEKSVVRHSIVHHVLREFMEHCDESDRSEMISALHSGLAEILHTKDGSRVAMMCLWNGSSKDRKAIVKSMKTHVVKIATEEQGHLVLLAAFDCLDDIKLLEKIIIRELMAGCLELTNNQFGRKILIYLLSPRDGRFFHPDIVNILKRGDGNSHSKKMASVRQEELRQSASPDLLTFAAQNLPHLLATNPTCMLLLSILRNSSGNIGEVFLPLVELLKEPYHPTTDEETHIVESAGLSFVFKKLLKDCTKENNERVQMFVNHLLEAVSGDVLKTWVDCNRGAFLLLNLLETNIPSVVAKLKQELHSTKKLLASKKYKGAELLLKKLIE